MGEYSPVVAVEHESRSAIPKVERPAIRAPAIEPPLIQLQRRYGNRWARRMVGAPLENGSQRQVPLEIGEVIDAEHSRGQSPSDGMRAKMEPVFGKQFGHVPVHTDNNAEGLSRAVAAGAFTTGGSRGVVRQRIQRIKIDTPGAGMGLRLAAAKDDSAVTIIPRAAIWVSGREGAHVDFGEGQSGSLGVSPGTAGVLQIWFQLYFFVDNSLPFTNLEYTRTAFTEWPFQVSPQGDLSLSEALPVRYGGESEPTFQLYLGSIDTDKGSAHVQATVNIVTTTQHGRAAGAGYEMTQTMGGRTWPIRFRVDVLAPRVEAPRVHYRTNAFFAVGSDRIEEGTEEHVVGWYLGLPREVINRVEVGSVTIDVRGYASTPQPSLANLELSDRRARRIADILRVPAGSAARIETHGYGAHKAQAIGEDQNERRVEIEITVAEPATAGPAQARP
jgi:flagellar motor protein MotB